VSVFLRQVADVGAADLEDPQSESRPNMAISAESFGLFDSRAVMMRASNCRWPNPEGR
jgi:hypothetical protein